MILLLITTFILSIYAGETCNDLSVINGATSGFFSVEGEISMNTQISKYYDSDNNEIEVRGYYYDYIADVNATDDYTIYITADGSTAKMNLMIFETCENNISKTVIQRNNNSPVSEDNQPTLVVHGTNTTRFILGVFGNTTNSFGKYKISFNFGTAMSNYSRCDKPIEVKMIDGKFEHEGTNNFNDPMTLETMKSENSFVWFHYKGEGEHVIFSVCNFMLDFDSKMFVVTDKGANGTCQGSPVLSYDDDGCYLDNRGSVISIACEKDVDYWIGVTGHRQERGQFYFTATYADLSIPSTCKAAYQVESIPFGESFVVDNNYAPTKSSCGDSDSSKYVYLSFLGTGTNVTIHTCRSITSSLQSMQTTLELFDSCNEDAATQATCIKDEESCYHNAIIIKETVKNERYYVKAKCGSSVLNCNITFEIFETHTRHDECVAAFIVDDSYTETAILDKSKTTYVGCSGYHVETKGALWYAFKKAANASNPDVYFIFAQDQDGSTDFHFEEKESCELYQCLQNVDKYLRITLTYTNRWVSVYPNNPDSVTTSIVSITKLDNIQHDSCETAMEFELPFSDLGYTNPTKSATLSCVVDNNNRPAAFYKFTQKTTDTVYISTCFKDTTFDSYIEITQGQCGDQTCFISNSVGELSECTSGNAGLSYELDAGEEYTISVSREYSRTEKYAPNFRIGVWDTTQPFTSHCDAAIEVEMKGDGVQSFNGFTKYAYHTNNDVIFGSMTKGYYYVLAPTDGDYEVTIETCNTLTQINSVISVFETCVTKDGVSYPTEFVSNATSYKDLCSLTGTYLKLKVEKDSIKYVFVSSSDKLEQDGFFKVDFRFKKEESSNTPDPSVNPSDNPAQDSSVSPIPPPPQPKPTDNSGSGNNMEEGSDGHSYTAWGIFGGIIYGLYLPIIVIGFVFVLIFSLKPTASYQEI